MTKNLIQFFYFPKSSDKFKLMIGRDFLKLFLVTLAIITPYTILIYALDLYELDNIVMEMMKDNPILLLLLGTFMAPLLEEPIYRLHLDMKKRSIIWSLGLSIFLIDEFWYPVVGLWIYLLWLLIQVSRNNPPSLKLVVYSSAILFGLVHLGNFPNLNFSTQFYLIPLLVGAQIFVGLIISYIRLTYGMKWAMIFHGVYNAVLIGAYLLIFDIP
jgi:hypothetical protein